MTVMTMSAAPSSLNPASVRPHVSSPLASNALPRPPRMTAKGPSFPTSRPLRPFPSIANTFQGASTRPGSASSKKPVKIIQPPADFKCAFVLNLTQAEFSRQD
ncbi:hypothetical protein POSPLADRAFT_1038167 [Postia placenta MAD-698-R-SB12]|uniref:Uncharacterized protein n=1 Tax=Postia placenta MAD-698-R-SB12 TaxID=670580 RepID=A0A1X6NGK1_9APHY|nr:hypothetical protein POSPLADRAFT_1038167 [Postia placenta MAD-698-R-SB12]OSX67771.1 hypothetical protein POSPLADRAFT_1038167 [Postia placenta MAD-698-R-SB12]